MAETKQQAKPMTALLHDDNELSAFDASNVPERLLSVLDVEKNMPLTLVKVDPLAILKIIKHARESYPTSVNGQLLGLEIDGVLEVTNAFAVSTQPGSEEDMTSYQVEMMQCLREVNVDSSSVGWYQSTRLGDFMQQPLLDVQASYQVSSASSSSSVVLIHDTAKSEQAGNLSLRAFRLSPTYLELAKSGKFTTKELANKGLTYGNILEELPIHVETSSLSKVLLHELQWPSGIEQELVEGLQRPSSFNAKLRAKRLIDRSAVADDTEAASDLLDGSLSGLVPSRPTAYLSRPMCTNALDLSQGQSGSASLLRQLETVGELIDEHIHDAHQWMYWKRGEAKEKNRRQQYVQRRTQSNAARVARGEKPEPELTEKELDKMFKTLPEPSRLDALLNTANLNLLTKGVTQSRGPALTKMYLAQGLQESAKTQ
ncbi:hypothetical protein COEREDRAFT_81373 [Coemansia reversa NRRL 1564]|uniref:Eukaryotic translation initiation factor 3 subunit H n=1 Tax=Coemansia reversa (strain ATCC 12441 / NRRL 1564) TaxID=763665 RepID=A0A2G5BBP0_COERN|nr:hypothetical protein COEREDRAFT_81373 [Coemansia reversa NRRL 1564]|eukprot:PIA16434.1 hypothetical protein COEREDRAFT_81373 [Coemansia reversa NRRL 1564]